LLIGVAENVVAPETVPAGTATTMRPSDDENVPPSLPIVLLLGGPDGMPAAVGVGIRGGGGFTLEAVGAWEMQEAESSTRARAAPFRDVNVPCMLSSQLLDLLDASP
jgi:hypothetical protein